MVESFVEIIFRSASSQPYDVDCDLKAGIDRNKQMDNRSTRLAAVNETSIGTQSREGRFNGGRHARRGKPRHLLRTAILLYLFC